MTVAPLVVRWVAGDATRVSLTLAAALGIEVRPGRPIAIPGLLLEITGHEHGSAGGRGNRLEVVVGDPPFDAAPLDEIGEAERSGPRFLALGWATVDLDRAAAEWTGRAWLAAPPDTFLGARTLVGALDPTGSYADTTGTSADTTLPDGRAAPAIVLLEPDTEGRLAAALARHGEGPAAMYIALSSGAFRTAMARLAVLGVRVSSGRGPFGAGIAVAGAPASSPTLVLVPLG